MRFIHLLLSNLIGQNLQRWYNVSIIHKHVSHHTDCEGMATPNVKVCGKYMLDNDMSSPSVAIKSSDAMGFIKMVTHGIGQGSLHGSSSVYRNSVKSATISRISI